MFDLKWFNILVVIHAFFLVSDSGIWLYNESKFVISKLSFWLKLLAISSRSNSSIIDQCVFLWSICKYFIPASVIKLCFPLNHFTELITGGSSPWFLPKGFLQPTQPQLLLHDLTDWRQGHFDLHSKHETTSFNFPFAPWPQRQSLFLLSDGDDDEDVFVFSIALIFLRNNKLKQTF